MSNPEQPSVGGQAVIEGVMMRSPRCLAIAVRRPDGTIVLREDGWISIWERLKFLRWPGFRGAVVLAESVYNGIQALNFAADQSEHPGVWPEESQDAPSPGDSVQDVIAKKSTAPVEEEDKGPSAGNIGAIAFSFAIAMGLFVGLPHALAWLAGKAAGQSLDVDSLIFHVLDGFFKLAIFVAYIGGISLIPEIRRVFEYHGAEHKVVNAYENNQPLTLESARSFTTFHARCGTSFMLFVLVLSMFMFAAIFPMLPRVSDVVVLNHIAMIFIKIPLMLPLAGIAYEINRYASKHPGQFWVQGIVFPGRLMQKLTTREPDDDQLEIALAAMHAALAKEAKFDAKLEAETADAKKRILVFNDYSDFSTHFTGH